MSISDAALKFHVAHCNPGTRKLDILSQNARQLLNTIQATFPGASFDQNAIAASCDLNPDSGIEGAQCAWSQVHQLSAQANADEFSTVGPALQRFSRIAQDVMSSTASNYDISKLGLGLLVTGAAALLVLPAICNDCKRASYTGVFLAFMIVGYGSMMFASSYVEEEQQFWYWICSGWLLYLHIRSGSARQGPRRSARSISITWAQLGTLGLAVSQRLMRRWNQTGQKFAAEPDIARTFFPGHPTVLWALLILTYADAGYHLFRSLSSSILPRLGALILAVVALMFKLNFVANDSPELLTDTFLSRVVGKGLINWSLVWQARLVFCGVAGCALLAVLSRSQSKATRGKT